MKKRNHLRISSFSMGVAIATTIFLAYDLFENEYATVIASFLDFLIFFLGKLPIWLLCVFLIWALTYFIIFCVVELAHNEYRIVLNPSHSFWKMNKLRATFLATMGIATLLSIPIIVLFLPALFVLPLWFGISLTSPIAVGVYISAFVSGVFIICLNVFSSTLRWPDDIDGRSFDERDRDTILELLDDKSSESVYFLSLVEFKKQQDLLASKAISQPDLLESVSAESAQSPGVQLRGQARIDAAKSRIASRHVSNEGEPVPPE
jgi:hypothetical protein